jgi:dolichol-phosphate mannosyltransferase
MPGGIQHGGPPFKTFLSRTAGKILRLCGFPSADATNNFKLYDGEWLARQQVESVGGFEIALELCYKAYQQGHRIVELPTEWYDREEARVDSNSGRGCRATCAGIYHYSP